MLSGPAVADIIIGRPGWADMVRVAGIGVAASWSVRPPGTLSAEVVTADLLAAFGTTHLNGRWVRWEHPTAGRRWGVITLTRPVKASGTTELAARDFSFLLSGRRTAAAVDIVGAPAGAIAARLVADASRVEFLWLNDLRIEETGAPIGLSARADDVRSVLNRLADQSGQEWRVTDDRDLEWRARLGVDRSGEVVLVEDRHILDYDYPDDLEPVVNDLLVTPANADYARTNSVVVEDLASIQEIGTRRQGSVVLPDRIGEAAIRPVAEALVHTMANQGRTLTLTTIDEEGVWQRFREGDTVRVLLSSVNESLRYRIMVRSYRPQDNTLLLVGDVLP